MSNVPETWLFPVGAKPTHDYCYCYLGKDHQALRGYPRVASDRAQGRKHKIVTLLGVTK